MEIGISLPQIGKEASAEGIVQVAQEAERLDYAAVWVVERLLRPTGLVKMPGMPPTPLPDYYGSVYDPIETLTYVAAKTERIKLGTSIIDALFHVPVVLARRLATLDQFSGGRVIAGLGQGWMDEEFETANVPRSWMGNGFEEFIEALRAAWGPNPASFSGRFYTIPESDIGPKPLQPGGPPLIIAAVAPPSIERAGRLGDGFNPIAFSWEMLETGVSGFRQAAQAAGRDPAKLPVVVRANAQVTEKPLAERQPLSGSLEQIAEDMARLAEMKIDHVFFDLNIGMQMPVSQQLRLLSRLRNVVAV